MAPDGEAPLVERAWEITHGDSALEDLASGTGSVTVVTGRAGAGRTCLLDTMAARAAPRGVGVLRARGDELAGGFPFSAALQWFNPLVEATDDGAGDLLVGPASFARPLFRPEDGSVPARQVLIDEADAIIEGLAWMTVHATATQPLLVVADDAQWLDPYSQRLLARLAAVSEHAPVLLAIGLRPAPGPATPLVESLAARSTTMTLPLAPLTVEGVHLLAEQMLGVPVAPDVSAYCHVATDGCPAFVVELLRTLEHGSVPRVEDLVGVIPPAIRHVATTGLRRWGPEATDLGRALAVLGEDATTRRAARLAGLDPADAARAEGALGTTGHVTFEGRPRFCSPLVEAAVHDDLLGVDGARLHADAARLLAEDGVPDGRRAAHLLWTRPVGDAGTAATLERAARQARADGDDSRAVQFLTRAIAEPLPPDLRGAMAVQLTEARAARGPDVCVAEAARAVAAMPAGTARARARQRLGRLQFLLGDLRGASASLDHAVVDAQGDADLVRELGPEHDALAVAEGSASLPARAGGDRVPVGAVQPAERALRAQRILALRASPHHVREVVGTPTDRRAAAHSLGGLGYVWVTLALLAVDELDTAESVLDAAGESMEGTGGWLARTGPGPVLRAVLALHRGDLRTSLEKANAALATARSEGGGPWDAWARWTISACHLEGDDPDAACAPLPPQTEAVDSSLSAMALTHAHARLELVRGCASRALELAMACRGHATSLNLADGPIAPWRVVAALAASAAGDAARARELAEEEVALARTSGAPRPLAIALRVRGRLAATAEARKDLEEAVGLLEDTTQALALAWARFDLGVDLRKTHPASARDPLREALDLGAACGSASLVRHARQELRVLGVRPRRTARHGPDSLTPSERRIAELAGEGMTNRQIGQHLRVTQSTVEFHLTRAYRKLQISSRRQLPTALATD